MVIFSLLLQAHSLPWSQIDLGVIISISNQSPVLNSNVSSSTTTSSTSHGPSVLWAALVQPDLTMLQPIPNISITHAIILPFNSPTPTSPDTASFPNGTLARYSLPLCSRWVNSSLTASAPPCLAANVRYTITACPFKVALNRTQLTANLISSCPNALSVTFWPLQAIFNFSYALSSTSSRTINLYNQSPSSLPDIFSPYLANMSLSVGPTSFVYSGPSHFNINDMTTLAATVAVLVHNSQLPALFSMSAACTGTTGQDCSPFDLNLETVVGETSLTIRWPQTRLLVWSSMDVVLSACDSSVVWMGVKTFRVTKKRHLEWLREDKDFRNSKGQRREEKTEAEWNKYDIYERLCIWILSITYYPKG